jgi:hypothetical protein
VSPVKSLLRDLWFHFFRRTRCLIRRKHLDLKPIGDLVKKGYRGVPVDQCHYCTEIRVRGTDNVLRFGGKLPGGSRS